MEYSQRIFIHYFHGSQFYLVAGGNLQGKTNNLSTLGIAIRTSFGHAGLHICAMSALISDKLVIGETARRILFSVTVPVIAISSFGYSGSFANNGLNIALYLSSPVSVKGSSCRHHLQTFHYDLLHHLAIFAISSSSYLHDQTLRVY